MLILLKHLKKHANVFQQEVSPCLSSFEIIHLENYLLLRTHQFSRISKLHYNKKTSDVNDLVNGYYLSSQGEQEDKAGTLFLAQFSTAGLRALIQSEHNHHGSGAALLLFGVSYTHDAEPHVEMKKHSKALDSSLLCVPSEGSPPLRIAALSRHTSGTAVHRSSTLPC